MSTAARSEKNVIELFDDMADSFESFSGALDSAAQPMNRWMAENLQRDGGRSTSDAALADTASCWPISMRK
jgi:hypothetical protein